jgi:hypothetical protein
MKNDRLDAAISYVRRGREVFPVPPGTKMGFSAPLIAPIASIVIARARAARKTGAE